MGYEVDALILDAYAKILLDADIDETKKHCGTTQQKTFEVETKFNWKKRKNQEGKASKFVQEVSKEIKPLIDAIVEKGRKRKDLVVHIEPVARDSKTDDETPLAFKRVVRKKLEESKVEPKKQSVRKVTIKLLT